MKSKAGLRLRLLTEHVFVSGWEIVLNVHKPFEVGMPSCTLSTPPRQAQKMETRTLPIGPEKLTRYPAARSPITGVLMGVHWLWRGILRPAPRKHGFFTGDFINVARTGAGVVWRLQVSDTGATLSLPDVLRDIPGERVNAFVGCLVITIFLAGTTTTVVGVLQCQQVYVSRWLSQVSRLRQHQ